MVSVLKNLNELFLAFNLALLSLSANAVTPNAVILNKDSGTYKIDTPHSKVGFEITHLAVSVVEGRFDSFDGEVEIGATLKDLKMRATIDSASINTNNKKRDSELRGPQFFDVNQYKSIVFVSRAVTGSPEHLIIKGDLSIRGITQTVNLEGKLRGTVIDPFGNTKLAVSANGKISRKAFGLLWSKTVEAGPVIGDEITLDIRVEAAKRNQNKVR